MALSTFLLALFLFLQSAVYLGWFAVDNKLLGLVGIVFVVIVLLEAVFSLSGRPFPLRLRRGE